MDKEAKKIAILECKKNNIPLLLRAENAMTLLCNDNEVILDANLGFVYFAKDKIV